jgi:hypothetical protein
MVSGLTVRPFKRETARSTYHQHHVPSTSYKKEILDLENLSEWAMEQ